MNDQDHADKIKSLVAQLNDASLAAAQAGLGIVYTVKTPHRFDGLKVTLITPKFWRTIE